MELATPRPQNVTGRRDEPARIAAAPRSEMLTTGRVPCAQIRVVAAGFGTRGHADEQAGIPLAQRLAWATSASGRAVSECTAAGNCRAHQIVAGRRLRYD
jgi:hypothetical protein